MDRLSPTRKIRSAFLQQLMNPLYADLGTVGSDCPDGLHFHTDAMCWHPHGGIIYCRAAQPIEHEDTAIALLKSTSVVRV